MGFSERSNAIFYQQWSLHKQNVKPSKIVVREHIGVARNVSLAHCKNTHNVRGLVLIPF